jgi:hypothetical protein
VLDQGAVNQVDRRPTEPPLDNPDRRTSFHKPPNP